MQALAKLRGWGMVRVGKTTYMMHPMHVHSRVLYSYMPSIHTIASGFENDWRLSKQKELTNWDSYMYTDLPCDFTNSWCEAVRRLTGVQMYCTSILLTCLLSFILYLILEFLEYIRLADARAIGLGGHYIIANQERSEGLLLPCVIPSEITV